jgi:hypothetical protein
VKNVTPGEIVSDSPNTVLVPSESFLKFDLGGITNGAVASGYLRLDKAGAHGIIQRLRVTHGSQELENLDNYYALVGEMIALMQSSDSINGKLNVLNGLNNSYLYNNTTREVTAGLVGERMVPFGAADINAFGVGAVAANRTYAISLMSLVGSLGSQYIPLFEMTSAPLTISLQLVSSALKFLTNAQVLAAGNNFTISNVEFIGSFIELSDDSIAIIRNSLGGSPLQYVIQSYANYTSNYTLPNANTSISSPVPAKYASLRSLFCIMRSQSDGATTFFSQASTHFNIVDWRLRIGSQVVPYKSPNTMVEHYAELIKAIGSLSDANHEPSINWYSYATNSIPLANTETSQLITERTKSDSFGLGFDCETYANADKDKFFAGMNTLNSDIYWNINFAANATAPNVKFDFYALYDNVLVFENGICYSKR